MAAIRCFSFGFLAPPAFVAVTRPSCDESMNALGFGSVLVRFWFGFGVVRPQEHTYIRIVPYLILRQLLNRVTRACGSNATRGIDRSGA